MVMPIGPLMIEHRWIERLIADVRARVGDPGAVGPIDTRYVDLVVDFLRTYADRCHHGKEEDILFKELAAKGPEPSLAQIMDRLISDHQWARATTRLLVAANASVAAGGEASTEEVRRLLGQLAAFYPEHIRFEDEKFFRPAMAYFTEEEQAAMLEAFAGFDATLIHEKYRQEVATLEGES